MQARLETVKQYLKLFGLDDRVQELQKISATVEQAAHALGIQPARIAKTISFQREGGCLLLVTAGDQKIDNGKYKRTFGYKAKMLTPAQVETCTGYPVGGVCPFANPAGAVVYLDQSLRRFSEVYPAAGTPNSAVRLTCAELETASRSAGWVDVCRPLQQKGEAQQ